MTNKFTSKIETDRVEAHFDLAAAALITGLTNVVSIRADSLSVVYSAFGFDQSVHGIGHNTGTIGKSAEEAAALIRQFHIGQIARLAGKLRQVREGDGTMLDNTLIVYLSDSGNRHHSDLYQWPMVLVGGLGSRLRTGGRYLEYPGYGKAGHRTTACLYSTILHAVGLAQDTFGQPDLKLPKEMQTGPLEELLKT